MFITRWTFFRVKLVSECDFEISWSLGPYELWTFGFLELWTIGTLPSSTTSLYFLLPPPFSSSYFFLPPPTHSYLLLSLPSSSCPFWVFTLEIEIWDWPWTFILKLKSCGWVVVVHLDYNVSSDPFFWVLTLEIEIWDGPGPELDNCSNVSQSLVSHMK